jgi:hypothetical protein
MVLKNYILILTALIIASIKWLSSYYFFSEELSTKIIFESVPDGEYFYPQIKYLSQLIFNQSFDQDISGLKILPIPLSGIIFHSILFKFLGFYSFIVAEFVCILIFLLIFYHIFASFFSKNLSFFFTVLIYFVPLILIETTLSNFQYLGVFSKNFYNFRIPRPMISNLYFFSFVLLILKMNSSNFYSYKNFVLLGLVLGLTVSSVYYYFLTEIVFLLLFLILKFKSSFLNELLNNYKYYLSSILVFLLIAFPFLIIIYLHEPEFTYRQGIIDLDNEKKIILFNYLFEKYLDLKFLIVFFILSFLSFLVNFFDLSGKKLNNTFYLLFLSSLISPLLFLLLAPKTHVFYHFINFIIVTGILYLIIFSFISFNYVMKKNLNKTFINILILLLLFNHSFVEFRKYQGLNSDNNYKTFRNEFSIINSKIRSSFDMTKTSLLSLESNLIIWAILNDIKYLDFVNGFFTSKKDHMLEEDIFSTFKKLGLKKENFNSFIENRKSKWRYINHDVKKSFAYKYQANSLLTYQDTRDFEGEELTHILKTSPMLSQQSIIPKYELDRLKKDFNNYKPDNAKSDIIVINKKDKFMLTLNLPESDYCKVFDGDFFMMFFNKEKNLC